MVLMFGEERLRYMDEPLTVGESTETHIPESLQNCLEEGLRRHGDLTMVDVFFVLLHVMMTESCFLPVSESDKSQESLLPTSWKQPNIYCISYIHPAARNIRCELTALMLAKTFIVHGKPHFLTS